MRILVVDDELVSRRKLELLLNAYGMCDTAVDGRSAIDLLSKAFEEADPYHLIALDIDLPDIKGYEILQGFRKWEKARYNLDGSPPAVIVMVTATQDSDTVARTIAGGCDGYLVKPITRASLETLLVRLGIQRRETEKAKPGDVATAGSGEGEATHRLKTLLRNAGKISDDDFFPVFESTIRETGPEADEILIQHLNTAGLPVSTIVKLIRLLGRLRKPVYLDALAHLAASNTNFSIRKDAIIAVSLFDNEQALNVLTALLDSVKNPDLKRIIGFEVNRMRQSNRLLGVIPRFLEGRKDMKGFGTTLRILKKIVTPEEVPTFIPFLADEDPIISSGAYELICEKAGREHRHEIWEYHRVRRESLRDRRPADNDASRKMTLHLSAYLDRHPELIDEYGDALQALFLETPDPIIQEALIQLLLHSPENRFLALAQATYAGKPELREVLTDQLSQSEQGAAFLLTEFSKNPDRRTQERLIVALLRSETGCRHFVGYFPTADSQIQLFILEHLNPAYYGLYRGIVAQSLRIDDQAIRTAALNLIRQNADFAAEGDLFDAELQEQLFPLGEPYIETIETLFPMRAIGTYFSAPQPDRLSPAFVNRFLSTFHTLVASEPLLTLTEEQRFYDLLRRELSFNEPGRNTQLLKTLQKLKTFDRATHQAFQEGLRIYTHQRERSMSSEEENEVRKAKRNFAQVFEEIHRIDEGNRDIALWMGLPVLSLDLLEKILVKHHSAFGLSRARVLDKLKAALETLPEKDGAQAVRIFQKYPLLHAHLPGALARFGGPADGAAPGPKLPRFYLLFERPREYALFRDQLTDLFPDLEITNDGEFQGRDILIADSKSFESVIAKSEPTVRKCYIVLDNAEDFAPIKKFNPVTFPAPVSVYRIVRTLLSTLYIPT